MTCKHDAIKTWRTDDGTPVMWSCVDCSRKFEPLIVPAAQTHTSVHPEYTPQRQTEPSQWRDMVVVNLVQEGVNKHKARELADHFAAPPQRQWVGLTDEEAHQTLLGMAEHIETFGDASTTDQQLAAECIRFILSQVAAHSTKEGT